MGLFSFVRSRSAAQDAAQDASCAALGRSLVAVRLRGAQAPAGCVQVIFSESGQSRRAAAGGAREGEVAYAFHPGPYSVDVTPYAAAPEIGLRTRVLIDAADPRVAQQRFDLYLFSEVAEALALADLQAAVEAAVQEALSQGMLDLPPCTSLDEWNGFRAGLNQLLYTRFGVTVEDCLPVDLGEQTDYAAQLRARAQTPPAAAAAAALDASAASNASASMPDAPATAEILLDEATPASAHAGAGAAVAAIAAAGATNAAFAATARDDAHALRRLFLELPALSSGFRQVALPPGQALFLAHRSLLQRAALLALDVNTMPALAWSAPDLPSPRAQQERRSGHSIQAARELDQAWALLARLQLAANPLQFGAACGAADPEPVLAALMDEAERIVANLDHHLAQRRAATGEHAVEAYAGPEQRREPSL
ncbi:hypothetical protein [Pseudoduganella aquatica]|uniref:hypothetical protein n=1 Tax=Pseudoduganella aquatica TaxID=2660641 RepID=UPI001E434E93|nr:hypothetical protein [Pseudoduganella aquatica]